MNTVNKQLHIAFFSGDITRSGGTECVCTRIASALVQQSGYRVSIVSMFENHKQSFFPLDSAITRHTLYPHEVHGVWRWPFTVAQLLSFVRKEQVDILIDADGILDMYSLPVKLVTGVKIISWEHFNYMQHPDVPYRKVTRKFASHYADAIVTLTHQDAEFYQRYAHPKCPVMTIRNPIALPAHPTAYDSNSRIIVSAGRLVPQKGFDMLIEVAKLVLPQHPNWQWVILGEGFERSKLTALIQEAHLEQQLLLLGRIPNIDTWLSKASMFVLTSRFEGLPMVLLEAKAHKLPIVSFNCVTGPAEIVTDSVNGYLVDCFDMQTLAARIEKLMQDKQKRQQFSEHALQGIEQFDIDTIMNQWQHLLQSMA